MKIFVLALAVSLAVLFAASDGRAAEVYFTGQILKEVCSGTSSMCTGYIMGFYDAGDHLSGPPGLNRKKWGNGSEACMPDGVKVDQLKEVVMKWLREHPEYWHASADSLAASAVSDAWPCS